VAKRRPVGHGKRSVSRQTQRGTETTRERRVQEFRTPTISLLGVLLFSEERPRGDDDLLYSNARNETDWKLRTKGMSKNLAPRGDVPHATTARQKRKRGTSDWENSVGSRAINASLGFYQKCSSSSAHTGDFVLALDDASWLTGTSMEELVLARARKDTCVRFVDNRNDHRTCTCRLE